jgi:integrase/recombinase XerD
VKREDILKVYEAGPEAVVDWVQSQTRIISSFIRRRFAHAAIVRIIPLFSVTKSGRESSWKKKYTDRGIRKILAKYSEEARLAQNLSPHKLRHFLLTWLKKQGIDDALIQPYSGHESRKSLEVYSKLAITDAQHEYNEVINRFPI